MKGKEKCKALKEIRKQIADNNNIEYVVSECKHKGECRGTCPKCEAEVRYLEKELEKKRNLGQKVAIAGVSMGIAASMSACSLPSTIAASAIGAPATVIFTATSPLREPEPEPVLMGEAIPVYPAPVPGTLGVDDQITVYPKPEPETTIEPEIMGDMDIMYDEDLNYDMDTDGDEDVDADADADVDADTDLDIDTNLYYDTDIEE